MDKEINQNIVHLLNQCSRLLTKEINEGLNNHNLYMAQWSIFFCLSKFGPMSQTAIWQYLNVEAPTVTRTLLKMEEYGWITRKTGKDKRERIIHLTEGAKQQFGLIKQTVNQVESELLANLSTNEKTKLLYLLNKISKPKGEVKT